MHELPYTLRFFPPLGGSSCSWDNTKVLRWASDFKALTVEPLNAAFLVVTHNHCAKAWLAAVAPHFSLCSRSVLKSTLVYVLGEESSTIPLELPIGFLMYHCLINTGSTP